MLIDNFVPFTGNVQFKPWKREQSYSIKPKASPK